MTAPVSFGGTRKWSQGNSADAVQRAPNSKTRQRGPEESPSLREELEQWPRPLDQHIDDIEENSNSTDARIPQASHHDFPETTSQSSMPGEGIGDGASSPKSRSSSSSLPSSAAAVLGFLAAGSNAPLLLDEEEHSDVCGLPPTSRHDVQAKTPQAQTPRSEVPSLPEESGMDSCFLSAVTSVEESSATEPGEIIGDRRPRRLSSASGSSRSSQLSPEGSGKPMPTSVNDGEDSPDECRHKYVEPSSPPRVDLQLWKVRALAELEETMNSEELQARVLIEKVDVANRPRSLDLALDGIQKARGGVEDVARRWSFQPKRGTGSYCEMDVSGKTEGKQTQKQWDSAQTEAEQCSAREGIDSTQHELKVVFHHEAEQRAKFESLVRCNEENEERASWYRKEFEMYLVLAEEAEDRADAMECKAAASIRFAREVQVCLESEATLCETEEQARVRADARQTAAEEAIAALQGQLSWAKEHQRRHVETAMMGSEEAEERLRRAECSAEDEAAKAMDSTRKQFELRTRLRRSENQVARTEQDLLMSRAIAEDAMSRAKPSLWTMCKKSGTNTPAWREEFERCRRLGDEREAWVSEEIEQERSALVELNSARARLHEEEHALAIAREVAMDRRHGGELADEEREPGLVASSSSARSPNPDGPGMRATIALVPDSPITVSIPQFEVVRQGFIGFEINYTVLVEGLGKRSRLIRQFSSFRTLHASLQAKPFASSLRPLPQDWLFAQFSSTMLERQRRELEVYLCALCSHAQVVLDGDCALWQWLGVDDLSQVVSRLVAARASADWPSVHHLTATLEAIIVADSSEIERCVHAAVLDTLKDVLVGNDTEFSQCAARLLEQMLVRSQDARQMFLSRANGGAEALLAATRGSAGGAAATVAQRVLEVVSVSNGDAGSEPRGSGMATRSREMLDECCVCLDNRKSHALLPCGHLCACEACAENLTRHGQPCPVCRQRIERSVQIFT